MTGLTEYVSTLVSEIRTEGAARVWKEEVEPELRYQLLRIRSDSDLVLADLDACQMYLSLSDPGISKELLKYESRERCVVEMMRDAVTEGMTVVDVGANIGFYALLEASLVGDSGQVIGFEPVERNFQILRENVRRNEFDNVRVFNKAVSNVAGTAEMYLTEQSNLGSLVDVESNTTVSEQHRRDRERLQVDTDTVETITLDGFLPTIGVSDVDVVRMDLEGYEREVFEGMESTLRESSSPCKLFIETHPSVFEDPNETIGESLRRLLEMGFRPKAVIYEGERQAFEQEEFVRTVCSYTQSCPHVVLEK